MKYHQTTNQCIQTYNKFNDGAIGIYDTKSGLTLKVAKPKADALNSYLSTRLNLKGGIIKPVGTIWKVSTDPFGLDISKWKDL